MSVHAHPTRCARCSARDRWRSSAPAARPGSFGERLVTEVAAKPWAADGALVNPRYAEIAGRPCHGSLADLSDPVDLVLLGVPRHGPGGAARSWPLRAATGRRSSSARRGRRPRPARPSASASRQRAQAAGHGAVRRWLHGVRGRGRRAACDRLSRDGRAAGRARRPGLALRVGVLRAAALAGGGSAGRWQSRPVRSWSRRPPTTSSTRSTGPRRRSSRCCWRLCASPAAARRA